MSRNSKLTEKYCINEKTHLGTEKNFVLFNSLKINKRWVVMSSGGGEGVIKMKKGLLGAQE